MQVPPDTDTQFLPLHLVLILPSFLLSLPIFIFFQPQKVTADGPELKTEVKLQRKKSLKSPLFYFEIV